MSTKRRAEIDIAKGFALFLMVLGHVVTMHHTAFRWIFSFHMPAFFFLSGMTFRPEKYTEIKTFILHKAKTLLLPYFGFTAVALVICCIRPLYREWLTEIGIVKQLKCIFYYTQPQYLYVGQLWFLVALFVTELMALVWFRIFGKKSVVVKCYSLFILALVAVNIQKVYPYLPVGKRLPWKIDTALCAAVFLIAGYYANKHQIFERMQPYRYFLIPIFVFLNYYFGPRLSTYVNICDCFYNEAAYYFTAAFCGIFALILTAMLCKDVLFSKFTWFWNFWQYCGRYSLQMLAAQSFILYLLAELLAKITGLIVDPMQCMPNHEMTLGLSIATFLCMAVVVYPWSLYKNKVAQNTQK